MAVTARWHATTGDYPTVGNWDGGVMPGAGATEDTAICDGVSQQAFTTNLDRTGDHAMHRFITAPEYGGAVGGPGNSLKMELESSADGASRVVHCGYGQFWFEGKVGGFTDIFVNSACPLHKPCMTLDGTIRNVFVRRGSVVISPTCLVTGTLWCCGPQGRVLMHARAGAETAPERVLATGGGTIDNRRGTSLAVNNSLTSAGPSLIVQTGLVLDATQIFSLAGGRIEYAPGTEPGGAHNPDIYCDASLDMGASPYDIEFDDIVIGPNAAIRGSMEHVAGFAPLSTNIDMREDFP